MSTIPMKNFEQISMIPRESENEQAIAKMLLDYAKALNLEAKEDSIHNVYVRKNASKGCENQDAVMLQGHIDMVCAKNNGVNHDFAKDPIRLIREGNLLHADGTTLGADNGTAVAYMMALMEEKDLVHPPLEFLFTAQEETSLGGAKVADPSFFHATKMINLDAGPEGFAVCGCAGGKRATIVFAKDLYNVQNKKETSSLKISINGFAGGHSGGEINKGRVNAIQLMGKLLKAINEDISFNIVEISGGEKDNIIASKCEVVICLNSSDIPKAKENCNNLWIVEMEKAQCEDKKAVISFEIGQDVEKAYSEEVTKNIITFFNKMPQGALTYNSSLNNLVQTSANAGILLTGNEGIKITMLLRSSKEAEMDQYCEALSELAQNTGSSCSFDEGYPGWEFNPESMLFQIMNDAYKETTGQELKRNVIHAGLECGILQKKLNGIDVVAAGPNVHNVHSPKETMEVDSFERFYEFLKNALTRISEVSR